MFPSYRGLIFFPYNIYYSASEAFIFFIMYIILKTDYFYQS